MTVDPRFLLPALVFRRLVATSLLVCASLLTVLSTGGQPAAPAVESASNTARPQPPPFNIVSIGRPSLRAFTSKDGLPQNAISTIVTDRNGMLWIGTKDGLASYNGRTWQVLNMPPEVGKNMISDIVHTANGDMWVTLNGGGVVCRRADGTWRNDPAPSGDPNAYPVLLAELDEPGKPATLVLLLQRTLLILVDDKWVPDPDFPVHDPDVAGGASVVVGEDGITELWMGLPEGRSARRRLGVWTVFPAVDTRYDSFFCFAYTSAFDGRRQLVAGRGTGLWFFDGARWVPDRSTSGLAHFVNIFKICESRAPDGTRTLWCGSIDGRSFRFQNGVWMAIDTDEKLKYGGVWSMLAAGDVRSTHAVWIGTAGLGLVRAQFGAWTAFDRSSGLVNESVYSLLVTKDREGGDVLWVGTISGGLTRFERGVPRQITLNNGMWVMWVQCMLDVSDATTERVLAGNSGNLVVIENGRVTHQLRREEGLPGVDVTSLQRDVDDAGRPFVWVGTSGGLCRFVDNAIVPPPPSLSSITGRVMCMAQTVDASGRTTLWIGAESGLYRYDGTQVFRYSMEQGLPTNAVISLRELHIGSGAPELWVGTRAGLARLSLDDSTPIRTLSTASSPALPNNTVYRIEQDATGRIYMPTNRGVVRLTPRVPNSLDPSEFDLTVFTTEDGLPNDECNTGASTVDHRGRIWVGTLSGAAVYDPAAEIKVAPSRLIVEKQLVVDDENRSLAKDEVLAHDRNHLVFEYALLSYNREATTRYRSQLIGYEPGPSDWSTDYRREFNSLPPGTYTFRIWGRDALGNVAAPVDIPFSVSSPPWWTWWAILLYGVGLLALGYLGVRWRLRTLAQRNVQLEAAIAQRTTELGHTVDELRVSQRSAQEANLAKSVFLANMSHELRTPLNAVLGFAQLLDRVGTLGPQERHKIGIIRRSGEHLLGLINDVLSLAKIEAGKLELHEQPFSPVELLSAVEAMTRVRADAKDLHFDMQIGDGFPEAVHGDDGKLRQVLLNLLGNAVKFTETGGVRLVANWSDGRGRFEIHDNGRGISSDEMDQLFEAFSQTAAGKATTEGTGLGLVISRQIVRLMGGEISAESEIGKGSTFRFDVALPESTDPAPARSTRRVRHVVETERRRRVLVVDDSVENRLLLTSILTSVGFDVREAGDGREALVVANEWRPRVIFMDRRMPVMDGVECTREIRRLELEAADDRGRVVIIATTASVFEQDREEILANGCDDLVIKPFQESEIFTMLERHARVQFVYDEEQVDADVVRRSSGNVLSGLARLDADVALRLFRALETGDTQAAGVIAKEIGGVERELGDEIARRIREFKMESLIEELERVVT